VGGGLGGALGGGVVGGIGGGVPTPPAPSSPTQ
jgi:hypothetical protein